MVQKLSSIDESIWQTSFRTRVTGGRKIGKMCSTTNTVTITFIAPIKPNALKVYHYYIRQSKPYYKLGQYPILFFRVIGVRLPVFIISIIIYMSQQNN